MLHKAIVEGYMFMLQKSSMNLLAQEHIYHSRFHDEERNKLLTVWGTEKWQCYNSLRAVVLESAVIKRQTGYAHHLVEFIRKYSMYVTFTQEPLTPKRESQHVIGATVHWLGFHVCDTQHYSSHCFHLVQFTKNHKS